MATRCTALHAARTSAEKIFTWNVYGLQRHSDGTCFGARCRAAVRGVNAAASAAGPRLPGAQLECGRHQEPAQKGPSVACPSNLSVLVNACSLTRPVAPRCVMRRASQQLPHSGIAPGRMCCSDHGSNCLPCHDVQEPGAVKALVEAQDADHHLLAGETQLGAGC